VLGKLTAEQLNSLIFSKIKQNRPETLKGGGVGEDCACLALENNIILLSSDPITATDNNPGALAVYVCCNDIAAAGAEPVAVLLTLLLPPQTTTGTIDNIVSQAQNAASAINVDIVGGHTEWTDAVTRPVICGTAVGFLTDGRKPLGAGGIRPGDALIMTKTAGLEGTAILTNQDPTAHISIIKEALLAAETPGTHAMHDVTEGGVEGAVWEMAAASGCGVTLSKKAIPITQQTKDICEKHNINPLKLIGSGSLLIATKEPKMLLKILQENNIQATVIGQAHQKKSIAYDDGTPIEPPGRDALFDAVCCP